ncbi:MAG: hypothetical protein DSZ23_02035 [Thermodesulfatator sp.]|nr:MAG: hypothetical protein DSZ23_02035 [Thermodesulfatator sp.]
MRSLGVFILSVFLLTVVAATTAAAGQSTLKILAPWQGHGQVFKVAPNKVKVVGSFDGIMYIDNGKGDLDAAVFMCPGTEYINLDTKETRIEADCIITKATEKNEKEKIAYATLTAKGTVGSFDGDFKINGGEGAWKGISGGGKVSIRTALGDIAVNKKTGEIINKAAGLAVWPALNVTLP